MKKLKTWQFVLLIVFYPVGIVYFIIWLIKRNSNPNVKRVNSSKMNIIEEFHTKVVGVTYSNDDGTSRQLNIKSCKIGDEIIFKPVCTKEFPEAVGVFTSDGKQLGHLSQGRATELLNKYPANPMSVTISSITGGGDYNYGCNILIKIYAI